LVTEGRFLAIGQGLLPCDEEALLHRIEIRLIKRNMLELTVQEP
jgi:hypothetical protein